MRKNQVAYSLEKNAQSLYRIAHHSISTSSSKQFAVGCTMILISWYILKIKGHLFLKTYEPGNAMLLELISIASSVVGYLLLWRIMLLPSVELDEDCRKNTKFSFLRPQSTYFSHSMYRFLCSLEEWTDYLVLCRWCPRNRSTSTVIQMTCYTGAVTLGIHFLIHSFIPISHRQSQEIILLLSRILVDSFLLLGALGCTLQDLIHQVLKYIAKTVGETRRAIMVKGLIALKYVCYAILFVLLIRFFAMIMGIVTIPQLQLSILGEPMDPCAGEGLQMKRALSRSWAFPAMHHRRLFNFFIGSEKCSAYNWHSIGFVDRDKERLILSSKCPGPLGEKPRVYIERPENSEFDGGDVRLVETIGGNQIYHAQIEALYGSEEKAAAEGVIVHRWPKEKSENGGRIRAVELNPAKLVEVSREPSSTAETKARKHWPGNGLADPVLEIPLGRSAAYSVNCDQMDMEEYFVQPMRRPGPWGKATSDVCNGADKNEMPGNILVILFDALSRQNVVRRLPRFTEWVRDFKSRQTPDGEREGYLVRELHHTTLGISTSGNFAPYFSGTSKSADLKIGLREKELNYMDRSLFNMVKVAYGERMSTSMTTGYCSDMADYLLFRQEKTGGRGDRYQGIDYYTFQPFCHAEYGAQFGNFKGPYSILPRCIDNRHVHEHFFDYLHSLLFRQLKEAQLSLEKNGCSSHFFNVAHFIESHEGTHGSIGIVDEALTAFMRTLEEELHFFANPHNTLLFLSDHGSHMGPYYEIFDAGQYERTTPAMLYFIHPETLRRVDMNKGRTEGMALQNFMKRSRRISTPLDLYLTLGDVLGLKNLTIGKVYQEADVPAASLFDKRAGKSNETSKGDGLDKSCYALFHGGEPFPCLLDFCEAK